MLSYTRTSTVDIHPFSRQQDDEEVIIGRPETGIFLALPPDAVEVLDQLAQGRTVGEVQDAYQTLHGEMLELDDFLKVLQTKGIVKSTDENSLGDGRSQAARKISYHFADFPQRFAQVIFGRATLICAGVLTTVALIMMCTDPTLWAHPGDLYFPDHRTATVLLLTVASYLSLFLHELAHLIAARSVGVNSRMGFGHRLWVLVAETDLTGLWSIPRRQRYLPLLAGLIVDFASCALFILALFAQAHHVFVLSLFSLRFLRAMIFAYYMRIIWQCLLFIRTDLYYVIATYLGCKNLMGDTEGYLHNRLSLIFPAIKRVDQSGVPSSEFRVVRIFSFLWLAGRVAALWLLFLVTIPVTEKYVRNLTLTFGNGFSVHPRDFIDALLLTAYILVPLFIGMGLWVNSIIRREGVTS